jgi:hypothetical protein
MSKVSVLARHTRELFIAMLLIAFVVLVAGCGASGSPASNTPPPVNNDPPAPAPIEGVATPTSVAVVTATNAQ